MYRIIRSLVMSIAIALLLIGPRGSAYASPAGHVLRTVTVGRLPTAVAVDSRVHRAYVVNTAENTVSVLDSRNGDVLRKISLGYEPVKQILGYQIGIDEGIDRVYVVIQREPSQPSKVVLLDARSGRALHVSATGLYSGKPGINTRAHRVFIPNLDSNTVSVLDGRSGAVLRSIHVGAGPSQIAVAEGTGHAFVANSDGTISMLDAVTGTVLRTVRTGGGSHGFSPIVGGPFGKVFVFSQNGRMTVLDATSGRVIRTVAVGTLVGDAGVDAQTGRMFVANAGQNLNGNSVSMLDARTGIRLRVITTGLGPVGVVVDAAAGHILVANEGGNSVSTLDAQTGTVLRTTPVRNPIAIAIDAGAHRVLALDIGSPFGKGHVMILDSQA